MDPISLIITALATGASSALSGVSGQAVRDAYAGLNELVRRRFHGVPLAESVLDQHEQAPEVWKAPLEQQLNAAAAGNDEEILAAARKVLALTDPEGAQAGKYRVVISGGNVGAVGDHANVQMGPTSPK
jgi:hypothetical protein